MTPAPPATAPAARVRGFDGLRAIAALLVFFEHKIRDIGTGAIGVWVFYCLSGYLIVGLLQRARLGHELSPESKPKSRMLLDFWRSRALRILPLYYAVVFVVFALTNLEHSQAFPYYLFYLQNFYIAWVTHDWSPLSHFWSLALEMQFYVLAAPILIVLAARKHLSFLGAVFFGCVAFALVAALRDADPMASSLMPPQNFAFMALGGIACVAPSASFVRRYFERASGLVVSAAAFAVAFVATRHAYRPIGGPPLGVYLLGLLVSAHLVAWTAGNQRSALVRLLELPPLRWLGTISYGFYVIHPFVPARYEVAGWLDSAAIDRIPYAVWALFQLALSLAIAHGSWSYFERRFLALKAKRATDVGVVQGTI